MAPENNQRLFSIEQNVQNMAQNVRELNQTNKQILVILNKLLELKEGKPNTGFQQLNG